MHKGYRRNFVIGLIALGGLVSAIAAAVASEPVSATTEKAAESDFIKTSDAAYRVMRDVQATRLAIFNGLTDEATKLVSTAQKDAAEAIKDAKQYGIDIKKPTTDGDSYVPIDASIALADSFVPTPEKAEHIEKANEHIKAGDKKQAVEVLRLAEIDVVFSTVVVPIKFASAHIDDAAKLIAQGKYYEANLALKAIEDSLVFESFGIEEVPKQARAQS